MLKWVRFQLDLGTVGGSSVLPQDTLRDMHETQVEIWRSSEDPNQTYLAFATGWFVQDHRGRRMLQHEGQVYGYMAMISFLPAEGIGVVVLTNAYYHHLAELVTQEIYDRLLGLAPVDRSGILAGFLPVARKLVEEDREFWRSRPQAAEGPTLALSEYTGLFTHPIYGSIRIEHDAGNLRVVFRNSIVVALEPYQGDTFATRSELFDFNQLFFRFRLDGAGKVECVRIPLDEWEEDVAFVKSDED